jgi:nucleoside triphosphatase
MTGQTFPEPTVGALVFGPDGRLFLMRSHKWRDRYVVPGGHIELGESMEDALRREVKEETGLDIHDIQFVCFQEFIYDDRFGKSGTSSFDYACRTDSTVVELNAEAQGYVWASAEDALEMDVDSYTERAIREYLRKSGAG